MAGWCVDGSSIRPSVPVRRATVVAATPDVMAGDFAVEYPGEGDAGAWPCPGVAEVDADHGAGDPLWAAFDSGPGVAVDVVQDADVADAATGCVGEIDS